MSLEEQSQSKLSDHIKLVEQSQIWIQATLNKSSECS